jgi:hypothetical protein
MIVVLHAKTVTIRYAGARHHIIARGNERRKIFEDKTDCKEFLIRLGGILAGTGTSHYAVSREGRKA